jgi:hypothetical protein
MSWVDDLFGEPKDAQPRMIISMGLTWRCSKEGMEVSEGNGAEYHRPTDEEMQKFKQRFNTFSNNGPGGST